jgi:hypothetical protein
MAVAIGVPPLVAIEQLELNALLGFVSGFWNSLEAFLTCGV